MYIEPRTNIRLLKDVPLDESFEHTIYFSNRQAQTEYFASKTVYLVPDSTYQRVNRGRCRLAIPSESIYTCNYMMFQNTSYGTKWFYAFITSVEYVADGVTEINFEIDPIQTYCFDWKMRQCLVERQHVRDDSIGANLIAENVDIGEYVCSDYEEYTKLQRMSLIVATGSVLDGQGDLTVASGRVVAGMYSGIHYEIFHIQNQDLSFDTSIVQQANQYIETITEKGGSENIVAVFMFPYDIAVSGVFWDRTAEEDTYIFELNNAYQLDTYVPKNKKLYTYPYNAIRVDTGTSSQVYKFEYFSDVNNFPEQYNKMLRFQIMYQASCAPSILLVPYRYKGIEENFGETLSLDCFGQCAYTTDSYKAWIAQNGIKIGASMMQNLALMGVAVGTGNPMLAANQVLGATQTLSSIAQAHMLPNRTSGQQSNNTLLANGHLGFYVSRLTVNRKYAKMIDDYFSKYGYAIDELRVPELDVRPHWTYVKTKKCVMECDAPADDVKKICSIFDNGITWWRHGSEVGNYSLDNSPV